MPWIPELFSAPALQQMLDRRRQDRIVTVPYLDGFLAGEVDALIGSFAGEPELHDPIRGRVRGESAFRAFAASMAEWLAARGAVVQEAGQVVLAHRGFEEDVVHIGEAGLPFAVVADHPDGRLLTELRVYHSSWPLRGGHLHRPPLLQPDPDLRLPDVVGDYGQALAAGDVHAVVAAFEPEGLAREPAGGEHVHRGPDELRAFYGRLFSADGGIPLEHCTLVDDGRTCGLEYNVVRWGANELPPQSGFAVYERGPSGRLAAARIYDDVDPPA
jgi:hypothetical protein